jgi:hypothetical protein
MPSQRQEKFHGRAVFFQGISDILREPNVNNFKKLLKFFRISAMFARPTG